MSIMEYNGSAVIAMCGKNCVALATDTRFGAQHQTIASDFQRIFRINDKCFVGLSGLASDVQTVMDRINFRMNLYKLREDRNIAVRTFNDFLSSFLYERRFGPWFVEPLVAGLEGPENKPFIAGQDLLGAAVPVLLTVQIFPPVLLFNYVLMYLFFWWCRFTDDFIVCGTAEESLYGTCETMYRDSMGPEDLFETISQCLLAAVDRDCLSGWGGHVVVITPDEIISRRLKGRQD